MGAKRVIMSNLCDLDTIFYPEWYQRIRSFKLL